jgi:iron complex outermembrane receptor protein
MVYGWKAAWLASAACVVLAAPGAARAQADGTVSELVVTAQKREQSLQDVPAAISAFGAGAIEQRGLDEIADLQFETPSLQLGEFSGISAATIRGVGLNTFGASMQPGVAIHVNGVYQARSAMGELAQVDLERVEVLRGPQGTLYGRNATGGAINFISKAPAATFGGYVLASYASYDEYRLQGVLNAPLGNRLRTRLVLDYRDRNEGFIRNVVPGLPDLDKDRTLSGRLRVAADLTPDLTLGVNLYRVEGRGDGAYLTLIQPAVFPAAAGPVIQTTLPRRTSANGPSRNDRDLRGADGVLTWVLGPATLKSTTSYYDYGVRNALDEGVNRDIAPSTNRIDSKTFVQEVTAAGDGEALNWVAGAFYIHDDYRFASHFDFPVGLGPFPLSLFRVLETGQAPYRVESWAAFGDATVALNTRLKLSLGGRYSKETIANTQVNRTSFTLPSDPCATPRRFEQSFDAFTPRGGLQYQLDAGRMAYASVSRGFKAGGFNSGACGSSFKPETLTAYEAGVKTRSAEGRLTLNGSAFYYDYQDLQLQQYVNNQSTFANASSATIKGLEAELAFAPDDHWQVEANLSLLDARYDDFFSRDGLNPTAGSQDLSGNRLNRAPRASGNLAVEYRTGASALGRLTARANLFLTSRVEFREFNLPADGQGAYSLLNATLVWDSPGGAYSARLFANNLTNEAYALQILSNDTFATRQAVWGSPRQVGVELRARF